LYFRTANRYITISKIWKYELLDFIKFGSGIPPYYAWVNSGSNHPPPGTPPGILPIDSSRGSGICLSYMCTGAGIGGPRDLTNGCPESHPQILRQQNLVSGTHVGADRILCPRGQGGVKFIVRISKNYTLCHANLNTTIKGLCFIIFHSSLIL
jgi:hypothetical protein